MFLAAGEPGMKSGQMLDLLTYRATELTLQQAFPFLRRLPQDSIAASSSTLWKAVGKTIKRVFGGGNTIEGEIR